MSKQTQPYHLQGNNTLNYVFLESFVSQLIVNKNTVHFRPRLLSGGT